MRSKVSALEKTCEVHQEEMRELQWSTSHKEAAHADEMKSLMDQCKQHVEDNQELKDR